MPPRIRLPPTITSSRLLLSTRSAAFPPSQRCIIILAKPMGLHHPPLHRRSFGSTPSRRDPDNELPSAKEERRSSLAKNFSSRLDHMQAAIFMAGQKINDLTGYSGIETLKKDIDAQEAGLSAAKANVQIAKAEYKAAIARRSDSQKEVNELLQRKHTWSPHDLERFTELYRSDHANEQAEIQAQNRLNEVEKEVESASSLLSKSILTRYHEEQVWSDKIRRASTWGTWMLMGINIALFIVVQLGLEPWKRRRLVNNFEEKVKIMLQEEKALVLMAVTPAGAAATAAPENQVPATVAPVAPAVEESLPVTVPKEVVQEVKIEPLIVEDAEKVPVEPAVTATPDLRDVVQDATAVDDVATLTGATKSLPSVVKERVWGLVSEDVVSLTQRDLTFYIAQGFAAGAVVAVGIVSVSMRGK